MKKISSLFLFAIFLCISHLSFSQDNTVKDNEFLMLHYYTFEGNNTSQDKLDAMEQSLAKLEFVSQAKVKYKFEKSQGQIILVVKQKGSISEGDKTFSPTSIKQTIIKNGFVPMEYSIAKYEQK